MITYTNNHAQFYPDAFLTINKGRVRIYGNENYVYFEDGQKFEIELFNPFSKKILAKIELNGKLISNSGIVIKPGQRIFLKRFIDTNNSFIFETYKVEDNSDAINAIKNNGKIRIMFYEEADFHNPYIPYVNPVYYRKYNNYHDNDVLPKITYGYTSTSAPLNASYTLSCSASNTSGYSGDVINPSSNLTETGAIEKGDSTSQDLYKSYDSFKTLPYHTIDYKILPKSVKHIEVGNLRQYCTECGSKLKNKWKHCPNCGNKI